MSLNRKKRGIRLNKAELVTEIASKADVSQAVAAKTLNAVVESVRDALSKGEKVTLIGFGTFSVSERPARKGRNPQTGDPIDIPAVNVPKFKAGSELKSAVRN